jgi:hypothetical protein
MGSTKHVSLPIVGLLVTTLCGQCAGAEILCVQGPAHDVRVEARGATVTEILAALGERYAMRYRGAPANRGVTATFEGPLRRVLTRLLEGNDYVIKTGSEGLEVIVLSPGSSASMPATNINRRGD